MEKIEVVFKIIELSLTLIGLVLVVFGWIIPYWQSAKEAKKRRKFEEELLKRKWKKEFVDKQISDFYGPIAALLREREIRFSLILYQLGRHVVFEKDMYTLNDLPEEDQQIWKHYVDTYLLPGFQKIMDIIEKNQHLMYNSEIPLIFRVFQEYVIGWELLDNQSKKGVPNYYEYYYSYNYPREFTIYIKNTLKALLEAQRALMEEIN